MITTNIKEEYHLKYFNIIGYFLIVNKILFINKMGQIFKNFKFQIYYLIIPTLNLKLLYLLLMFLRISKFWIPNTFKYS